MTTHAVRLAAAKDAVARACIVCRRVQQRLDQVRALAKDDKSPVTVADFASQAVVAEVLRRHLGQVTLVAEEAADELRQMHRESGGNSPVVAQVLDAVRVVWPDATIDEVFAAIDLGGAEPARDALHGFWTLDPIDGTKGFLRGEQYAVSLAWIEGDRPVLGALGCPNLARDFSAPLDTPDAEGVIYYAAAGEGVWELSAGSADAGLEAGTHQRRLSRGAGEALRMCESVESGHSSHDDSAKIMSMLGERTTPIRLDSQAKYAVVARGQADVYLRLPTKKGYVERIWDHAAGALIAMEAGVGVTDIDGKPLDFSHGRGLEKNRGVVVAPPAEHGRIIGAIRELGIGAG